MDYLYYGILATYLDTSYSCDTLALIFDSFGTTSHGQNCKPIAPPIILRIPIFFLIYINDLPNLASIGTQILLYADDTCIIVTSPNLEKFETKIDNICGDINNWFKVN